MHRRRRIVQLSATGFLLLCVIAVRLGSRTPPADRSTRPEATPQKPAESLKNSTDLVASPPPHPSAIPRGPIHFTEVTQASGVDFMHSSGDSGERPFPAQNGSGAATFDLDLDGNVDLYFLTGVPFPLDSGRDDSVNRCYHNHGEWNFRDVTGTTGLGFNGYSSGVAVGDIDADGFPDVLINGVGSLCLYRNQGDGTFSPTESLLESVSDHWGTSAAFLDYDNDGFIDLYVGRYAAWKPETNRFCGDRERGIRIFCDPRSVEPISHLLLHNEGDGRFHDASRAAGIGNARGRGQGVVAADFDGDGRTDLFVGNDLSGNFLFLNAGDGTFRDVSLNSGTAADFLGRYQGVMGVDTADVNHDGRLDLFVTAFAGEHNALYENLGSAMFEDVSRARGLASEGVPWVGWGTALHDLDLDGWPDVLLTNGHVDANLSELGRDAPYEQPPLLWQNVQGRFSFAGGAAAGSYFATAHAGRGLAAADLDNDGDTDVVITHQDGPPALLRNDHVGGDQPDWIRVQVIGTVSNRDAVGAELRLTTAHGRTILQQVKGGGSYLSAHDPRQIMATGRAAAVKLEIRWPGGKQTEYCALQAGLTSRLIER